jgi:hypothetical protein
MGGSLSDSLGLPPNVAREALLERRTRTSIARFGELYRRNGAHARLTLSFELFPPRTPEDEQ